ncbi:MAG: hypothetical protein AAF666_01340 [Pseudomonadota bacterium]
MSENSEEHIMALGTADSGFLPSEPLNKPINWRLYFFFRILRPDEKLDSETIKQFADAAHDMEVTAGDKLVRDWLGRSVKFSKDTSLPIPGLRKPPRAIAFRNWLAHLTHGGVDPEGKAVAGGPISSELEGIAKRRGRQGPLTNEEINAADVPDGQLTTDRIKAGILDLIQQNDDRGAIALLVRLVRDNLDYGADSDSTNWTLRNVFDAALAVLSELKTASAGETFAGTSSMAQIQFLAHSVSRFFDCFNKDDARRLLSHLQHGEAGLQAIEAAGQRALAGGLTSVVLYDLLRSMSKAPHSGPPKTALREGDPVIRQRPIDLCFTQSGLEALDVDKTTRESFPQAFKEGMAARAQRLGDIGDSAPENWEGELGQSSIHGYFTGGFRIGPAWEEDWERLRGQIDAFNQNGEATGKILRTVLQAVFQPLGLEILHIELGQYPYELETVQTVDGPLQRAKSVAEADRREHFGFRDGISQPYANMMLKKAPNGGGIPLANGSWRAPAAGEIYLGQTDEDGNKTLQPCNGDLRRNGTFKVFRKLEQDVTGFRTYLEGQHPDSKGEQERLAAEIVGRWKDGRALTKSQTPKPIADDSDPAEINDFRFLPEDAKGGRCPLGAHIRRSNPRDIADEAEARRHRIQRMGIAYGGALIADTANADERKRGLLFVCANARIDMQFELIQGKWINNGEFLGQAGLGKCPLIGNSTGQQHDAFIRAGGRSRATNLPAFVTTRGGDYFFAPGVDALRMIAGDCKFPADKTDFDDYFAGGYSMNRAQIRDLFDEERMQAYGKLLAERVVPAIRVTMPSAKDRDELGAQTLNANAHGFADDGRKFAAPIPRPKDDNANNLVFFADHSAVSSILRGDDPGKPAFSREPYAVASRAMARGETLLVGTDPSNGSDTPGDRERLAEILGRAWNCLNTEYAAGSLTGVVDHMRSVTAQAIEQQLQAGLAKGRIDLVGGLAARTVEAVVTDVFGVPGPNRLGRTPFGIIYPREPQEDGRIPPLPDDWRQLGVDELLRHLDPASKKDQGFVTMRAWSVVLLLALVGNVKAQKNLDEFAARAVVEFRAYLSKLWDEAKGAKRTPPKNFLDALVAVEPEIRASWGSAYTEQVYTNYVMVLLLEMVGTAIAVIPRTFAAILEVVFEHRIDLPSVVPVLQQAGPSGATPNDPASGLARLVHEAERLNPNFPVMLRRCASTGELNNFEVRKGEWIAAFIAAANLSKTPARQDPDRFSLAPWFEGEARPMDEYFVFGVPRDSEAAPGRLNGSCWGRDRMVLMILEQLVAATGRMQGLRRLAGPEGDVQRLLIVPIGLHARFSALHPS